MQVGEDKKEHPIAYASKPTTEAQSKKGATKLEAEALLWAVTHFKYYLTGNLFTVITDCEPLVTLFNTPSRKHEIYKEAVLLQGYRMIVKHRSGFDNGCADALSRLPQPSDDPTQIHVSEAARVVLVSLAESIKDRLAVGRLQRNILGCDWSFI